MSEKYFNSLNYSMANEDTTLEYRLAESIHAKKVLSVGGSGSRCLPFLATGINELRIVDVSSDQLLLIELKLQTIRQLSREDAIAFWSSADKEKRQALFQKLNLKEELVAFYSFHANQNTKLAPLYWGKWEKTFRTFSRLTALLFNQRIREGLFTVDESFSYYERHIKGWKWDLLLKLIGNKAMFNSLLYKGNFIQKNSPLTYYGYYFEAFERLFKLDVKKSHFLQLCFFGEVLRQEALPIEFSSELFPLIKSSPVNPIFQQGSIFERGEDDKYDLVSLSDVPSYLSGEIEKKYLQNLSSHVAKDGMIVNRFYLRVPEGTDTAGFSDVTAKYNSLIAQELVQMYQVQILNKL